MRKGSISGSLYRLIYCSRNVIAKDLPPEEAAENLAAEIRAIVATAKPANTANGVTGALLFTASGFAQVLEGPRDIVEKTFERIGADCRHSDVTVLSFTPTERRCFPDWPMGFCGPVTDNGNDPLSGLLSDVAAGRPRVTTGSDVLRLMEKVVRQEEQWTAA
jgi:hypothetical protein